MPRAQPVKTTSGGGFTFEDHVGAFLATALLVHQPLLGGATGRLGRIDFQVAADGWRLDDVLVTFIPPSGAVRWCISVKSNAYVDSTAPADFVDRAWQEVAGLSRSGYVPDRDLLGLVTAPLSKDTNADLQELIRLSREQDPNDLDRRIQQPGYVSRERRALWESVRRPASVRGAPGMSASPATVLSRLRTLEADFEHSVSTMEAQALRWCGDLLVDPTGAGDLWNALLTETATVRTAGGYIDEDRLLSRLGGDHTFKRDSTDHAADVGRQFDRSMARLVERWRAVGVDELVATDLAADTTVGTITDAVSPSGIVALVGDFGAGKSVAAERIHQEDLRAYLVDRDEPVPICLRARDLTGSLGDGVNAAAGSLSERAWDDVGVRAVLDGLDEVGFSRGSDLLADARVLVRTSPSSRVVITARPGFDFRPEEVTALPPLTDEELADLSLRLTGHRFSLYNVPEPVRDAVTRPLFAIIALLRQARATELPASRALFIDSLVRDALGGSSAGVFAATGTLARGASQSIAGSGWFSVSEVGGPDVEAELVASRLVVHGEHGLRFSLPIIEQYFGAHALLRDVVDWESAVGALDRFESWRYAFVVAVGIGTWEQASSLLTTLGETAPGAACWVIKEAISQHSGFTVHDDSPAPLPESLECARRLRGALSELVQWICPVAQLTHLTTEAGDVVTVGASSRNGQLVAGLIRSEQNDLGYVEFDSSVHPLSQSMDPSIGPLRAGRPPVSERAWPWRWTLDWVGGSIEHLLERRGLLPTDDEALVAERRWSLVRQLVGGHSLLHPPIEPDQVAARAEEILRRLGSDPRSMLTFHGHATRFPLTEIHSLVDDARGRATPFVRPWPTPDNTASAGGWVSNLYTPEHTVTLLQEVYTAALGAYVRLVEEWFATWKPTLGWGAALPIRLELVLVPRRGSRFQDEALLSVKEVAVPSWAEVGVTTRLASIDDDRATAWRSEAEASAERENLARLRPTTIAWVHLHQRHGAFNVFGDTPATDLAYAWIWRDLHEIGLIDKSPPHTY